MASNDSGSSSGSNDASSSGTAKTTNKRGSSSQDEETSGGQDPAISNQGSSTRRTRCCKSAAVKTRDVEDTASAFVRAAKEPLAPDFLPYYPSIQMDTGEKVAHGADWQSENAASDIAERDNFVARMIGKITLNLTCANAVSTKLLAAKTADRDAMRTRSAGFRTWDRDGEFLSKEGQHVPVSRLKDMLTSGDVTCEAPPQGPSVLGYIANLQTPKSPSERPLLRALSTHRRTLEGIDVTFYVYVSRLFFDCVADPFIVGMMAGLDPIAEVTPPVQAIGDPTCPSDSGAPLSALVKEAESSGYPGIYVQPTSLKVDLLDSQRSTCRWMLDQERAQHGLNGNFWQKREWADGGAPFYHFPRGGQLRLAAPPHVTGGLLCEDVGLSKTAEVISTILANPLEHRANGLSTDRKTLRSGATLIVVPSLLLEQWTEEIRKSVESEALRVLAFVGSVERDVLLSSVEYSDLSRARAGRRSCLAPCDGCLRKGTTLTVGQEEKVRVAFTIDEQLLAGYDVVLTTYDFLERKWALFQKVDFHRVVLNNCQDIQSAKRWHVCSKVKATHRWLVSDTPFASGIDGLHQQLKILQVAPFGEQRVWNKIVAEPFAAGNPETLRLLDDIRSTVMQHSKSQRRKNGSPLVETPSASVEWRGVDMATVPQADVVGHVSGPHARYVYKYLERLSVSMFSGFRALALANEGSDSCFSPDVYQDFFAVLQRVASHPDMISLEQLQWHHEYLHVTPPPILDAEVDYPSVDWESMSRETCEEALAKCLQAEADGIRSLPAEDILRCLMKETSDNDGGPTRDVNRHWAVGNTEEMELRSSLKEIPLSGLRQRLMDDSLPVPTSWVLLKPRANIDNGGVTLSFTTPEEEKREEDGDEEEIDGDEGVDSSSRQGKGKGKRRMTVPTAGMLDARKFLKVSDTIRVGVNHGENETVVATVQKRSAEVSDEWAPESVKTGRVYRYTESTRRKQYVDLLVAAAKAKKSNPAHVTALADVYKGMVGSKDAVCTICRYQPVCPTFAMCGHVFCRNCISRMLKTVPNPDVAYQPLCPNCRTPIKGTDLMEMAQEEEAAVAHDDGNGAVAAEGLTLVVPAFNSPPMANLDQLRSAPMPNERVEEDPEFPMLGGEILSQHRAAVMSPSSVKLDAMVRDLEETLRRDPTSKFVILSQYPEVAEKARLLLEERGIRVAESCLGDPFNAPDIKAVVLATSPGSSGPTLTGARTVYVLDPAWNAVDEALALNSVRHLGQTEKVRIVIFYVKDTVEERLLTLRQEKGNLGEFLENSDLSASPSFVDTFSATEFLNLFGALSIPTINTSMEELPSDPRLISTLGRALAGMDDDVSDDDMVIDDSDTSEVGDDDAEGSGHDVDVGDDENDSDMSLVSDDEDASVSEGDDENDSDTSEVGHDDAEGNGHDVDVGDDENDSDMSLVSDDEDASVSEGE